jgi:hypothetical protein
VLPRNLRLYSRTWEPPLTFIVETDARAARRPGPHQIAIVS